MRLSLTVAVRGIPGVAHLLAGLREAGVVARGLVGQGIGGEADVEVVRARQVTQHRRHRLGCHVTTAANIRHKCEQLNTA